MDNPLRIGIIGGSGVYSMPGLENVKEIMLDTPFGSPSSPIIIGELEGKEVAFLIRHGINHSIPPHKVNYRANVFALKMLEVKWIISISACGSLREEYSPGDIIVPDQIFDFTKKRENSFFDSNVVAHIDVANPFCPTLRKELISGIKLAGAVIHEQGTTITIEGPRFSTIAESNVFRNWGMSVINMTTSPEAFLAREAEICYAVMNHVTDYDVWHEAESPVNVNQVINVLNKNTIIAHKAINNVITSFDLERECIDRNALDSALVTNPESVDFVHNPLSNLISKYRSNSKWASYWKK